MRRKNTQNIAFDDRNLPVNPMSKERMEDLEMHLAPFVKEIKQKLKEENDLKIKHASGQKS
ncbi:hypothetical protein [Anditalea andensis]|uniref:Uncharacterized protein n=1 Tax=Anditalea andensis TaxID=1048983 RepID=A0A074L604_9BACT|nr:hypothetical protein [Anditalea andensis]KEO75930.1 hypothetical protein EL17_10975 [Anditalea andensis]